MNPEFSPRIQQTGSFTIIVTFCVVFLVLANINCEPLERLQQESNRGDNNGDLANFAYITELDGTKYYISIFNATWADAERIAQEHNGHLVTISNKTENDIAVQGAQIKKQAAVWIGLTNDYPDDVWRWVTQEPVVYGNWAHGEPNNIDGREHWAIMLTDPSAPSFLGQWNDANDDVVAFFIMEVE